MQIVTKPGFRVMGIAVKTCNRDNPAADIGNLWQRFFAENVVQKIPQPLSQAIYAVYTNYEGDYLDPYETIIGLAVDENAPEVEGLVSRMIPEQGYQKFTAIGKMPEAIADTWYKIWSSDMKRNYFADFEVYDEKSQDPVRGEVDIFVGVK